MVKQYYVEHVKVEINNKYLVEYLMDHGTDINKVNKK